jgi:hypothetical protein
MQQQIDSILSLQTPGPANFLYPCHAPNFKGSSRYRVVGRSSDPVLIFTLMGTVPVILEHFAKAPLRVWSGPQRRYQLICSNSLFSIKKQTNFVASVVTSGNWRGEELRSGMRVQSQEFETVQARCSCRVMKIALQAKKVNVEISRLTGRHLIH